MAGSPPASSYTRTQFDATPTYVTFCGDAGYWSRGFVPRVGDPALERTSFLPAKGSAPAAAYSRTLLTGTTYVAGSFDAGYWQAIYVMRWTSDVLPPPSINRVVRSVFMPQIDYSWW